MLYAPTQINGVTSGLLLTYYSNTWGTVCDDFSASELKNIAIVACRALGYAGGTEYDANGASSGYLIVADNAASGGSCTGNEALLRECGLTFGDIQNCEHREDIGVRCVDTNPPPTYVHTAQACVLGENIVADTGGNAYPGSTVDECKIRCDTYGDGCKDFEFGVDYGGAGGNGESADCRLQSSAVTTGCSGAHYNVDFYEKVFPPPPPPSPPPPSPSSPPTRSCTCKASWTYLGVTSFGCANPDQRLRWPVVLS